MRVNYQRSHIGMLAVVFSLVGVTLYMAFAFPHSLLHFKQSETTEIKAVIIVGRHGEVTPTGESYFDTFGEEPPEEWFHLGGPSQLTPTGKERMYLLGKFLKLRYYERLLAGNPRKLYVRSENSDKSLESAQALLAGLNPPRDKWIWSQGGDGVREFATSWQPKAVHTTSESEDDLLASQSKCLEVDTLRATWKNSSRYSLLLNEFRHDLQMLRQNTGLEFEDDLEMTANIVDQLASRMAFDSSAMPAWYTSTLAQRLAYIADVTASCRFSQTSTQRLFAGRLLNTILKKISAKIRSDLTAGVSLLTNEGSNNDDSPAGDSLINFNTSTMSGSGRQASDEAENLGRNKLMPHDELVKLKLERQNEPNMFIYMTDKQHLNALMNSLKIYAGQPHYGAALIIELHYDPINQIHFLRLFLVNSATHNLLPEPVRVNPIACLDSVECSPQQFDQNTRHLALDKQQWSSLCANIDRFEQEQLLQELTSTTPFSASTNSSLDFPSSTEFYSSSPTVASEPVTPADRSDSTTFSSPPTALSINETTTMTNNVPGINDSIHLDKLDESLVVGLSTTTSEPPTKAEFGSSSDDFKTTTEAATKSPVITILSDTIKSTTTQLNNTEEPSAPITLPPNRVDEVNILTTEASTQMDTATKIIDVAQPIDLQISGRKPEP